MQTAFGTFGRKLLVLGGGGQQVDVAEPVILRVHGVHPVDKRLHLTRHLIVIDRRCPANDIRVEHALHDRRHIVLEHTRACLLTLETTDTEFDLLAAKRDQFHFMSRTLCAFRKLLRHRVAIRSRPKARRNNNYFFI